MFLFIEQRPTVNSKKYPLPCQIKELRNKHELITTANKLGHGISYIKLQELLSEVAYVKTEAKKVKIELPKFCNRETFTML